MYCSKCGSPNQDGARFCEKCGTTLAPAAAPAPMADMAAAPPPPAQAAPGAWQPPPPQPYYDQRVRGGYAPQPGMPATGKNPVVAVLLSCFIPGVGQFYNGDNKKGAIMLAVWFVSLILIMVVIGIFSLLAVWIYSMIDAYQVASGQKPVSA